MFSASAPLLLRFLNMTVGSTVQHRFLLRVAFHPMAGSVDMTVDSAIKRNLALESKGQGRDLGCRPGVRGSGGPEEGKERGVSMMSCIIVAQGHLSSIVSANVSAKNAGWRTCTSVGCVLDGHEYLFPFQVCTLDSP